MKRVKLPRAESLIMPEVENPFVHQLNLTTLDKIQIVLMTITVFPVRLILLSLCLSVTWLLAAIALARQSDEQLSEPMTGWRRQVARLWGMVGWIMYQLVGFRYTIIGEQVESSVAPIITCAPHSSFTDSVIAFVTNEVPSGVSKAENKSTPIFGTLTRFTQPVFVSREDPNSRQNTIKEIKSRAQSGGKWPQIVIFPEGTCTNRSCLISFKPGAFYPGVPVQPVCLKYSNRMNTITWTWEGPGAFKVLWLTLCQFCTDLEVHFLPVYNPSEEEINDPKLFAKNVRIVMAEALGCPITDHTYEDCRLMAYAAKLDMPAAAGLVEFQKISKKLRMNFDNMKELLDKFCKIAQKNKGHISMEELAEHLEVPISDPLREMFELYDRSGSGSIDFREYVIGLHLVARPANTEDTIRFAFELFDAGGKGYITEQELTEILQNAFGMDEVEVDKLFQQVDADGDGKIIYDEFKAYAEAKPEYAKIFTNYQNNNKNLLQVDGVPGSKVKAE